MLSLVLLSALGFDSWEPMLTCDENFVDVYEFYVKRVEVSNYCNVWKLSWLEIWIICSFCQFTDFVSFVRYLLKAACKRSNIGVKYRWSGGCSSSLLASSTRAGNHRGSMTVWMQSCGFLRYPESRRVTIPVCVQGSQGRKHRTLHRYYCHCRYSDHLELVTKPLI